MKIDLHVHLDGSWRPDTVWELAAEQGIRLPVSSRKELACCLQVAEDCNDLTEYLKCFDLPLLVLQKPEAMERVVFELCEDLAGQGLTYAEIRFAPQLSLNGGMSMDEVVEAAISGMNRGQKTYPSLQTGLLLCFMRGRGNELLNERTLASAKKYCGKGVLGVDLAGAEALFPTENYRELFCKVKEAGIKYTIHAGEAAGPESVRHALEFGATRLGHGVRAVEDEELVERLVCEKITLEVCPTSNLHTKLAKDPYSHPIRTLFDRGVRITVNTDNMTVSNTTLEREYAFLKQYYHFTDYEIEKMQEYAREAAFLEG